MKTVIIAALFLLACCTKSIYDTGDTGHVESECAPVRWAGMSGHHANNFRGWFTACIRSWNIGSDVDSDDDFNARMCAITGTNNPRYTLDWIGVYSGETGAYLCAEVHFYE